MQISGVLHNDGHAIVFNRSRQARRLLGADAKQKQLPSQLPVGVADNNDESEQLNGNKSQIRRRSSDSLNALESPLQLDGTGSLLKVADSAADDNQLQRQEADSEDGGATGNEIQLDELRNDADDDDELKIQFAGAGLAYPFRFEAFYLRFGAREDNRDGSEHRLGARSFAAELQLIAYNSHLYRSYDEASTRPHGLLAIGVFVEVPSNNRQSGGGGATEQDAPPQPPNKELERFVQQLDSIGHRGAATLVRDVNLTALLPETDQFVSYDGSLTQPSCHETVHWLILNRPIYISQSNVS